jgi:hypothetical protein
VTIYRGGLAQDTQAFSGAISSAVVTGLTSGVTYTFKVAARNSYGAGPLSAPSAAVVIG